MLVILALKKLNPEIQFKVTKVRLHINILGMMLKIGIPAGMQSVLYAVSNIVIQSSINSFGTDTIAAWTAYGKIDAVFWMTISSLGIAMTTFVGQNYGAGKHVRIKRSVRISIAMGAIIAIIMSVGFLSGGYFLFRMFCNDKSVISIGLLMMKYLVPFYVCFVCVEIMSGALRGMGDVIVPMIVTCLSVDGSDLKLGDDPKAYLISAHTQFDNLYFISLYRHYDVDFDNPYSNAYSEHQRFEDTILEKNIYALTNPTLSDLYLNCSQAQPEEGIYFETRYKFDRFFTINRSYLDIYERLTDGRRSVRFQTELEFRPIYALGLRLRYKNQVNRYDDYAERGVSKTDEYTVSVRTFLSNRDFLEFEYRYNTVWGPPYTSLTYPTEPGNNTMAAAQTLMVGDYIGVNYTHNFNTNLKLQGSFIYWFGHGIYRDWE